MPSTRVATPSTFHLREAELRAVEIARTRSTGVGTRNRWPAPGCPPVTDLRTESGPPFESVGSRETPSEALIGGPPQRQPSNLTPCGRGSAECRSAASGVYGYAGGGGALRRVATSCSDGWRRSASHLNPGAIDVLCRSTFSFAHKRSLSLAIAHKRTRDLDPDSRSLSLSLSESPSFGFC